MKQKIYNWVIINTLIAGFIYLLQLEFAKESIRNFNLLKFIDTLFSFQVISLFAMISSYHFASKLSPRSFSGILFVVIPVACLASFCGIGVLLLYHLIIYGPSSEVFHKDILINIFKNTSIITLIIAVIASRIEHLEKEKKHLHDKLENLHFPPDPPVKRTKSTSLCIKEGINMYTIQSSDIIYISSHGKNIVVHTIEKEYKKASLLSSIENSLPENFMRIHKSYIINLQRLSHIQYNKGGSYLAYLNDEEETVLPVGRKFAPHLKEKLKQS
ncbi:MAG: LytTR family transcriptional regulator [Leptospiraceae bacterium]|nr:LytTR family transcriptional regulator [Leptospiraceae bacterium]MCP5501736.1 LytTR family transcriptional regulator [Leptospiraceae bacterium]